MKKEYRTEQQTIRSIRTAGLSFLGMRLGQLVELIDRLDSSTLRDKVTQEFFDDQLGYHDKALDGTRARVSASLMIIRSGRTAFALETVARGNDRVDPRARRKAEETLERLNNGSLIDPFSAV